MADRPGYAAPAECAPGDARQEAICTSILRHLRWTWTGHGILSPGRRSSDRTVVAVYCEQALNAADAGRLRALASRAGDPQVRAAAEDLHVLATGEHSFGAPVADNSILSPRHPAFVLRNGCAAGAVRE